VHPSVIATAEIAFWPVIVAARFVRLKGRIGLNKCYAIKSKQIVKKKLTQYI